MSAAPCLRGTRWRYLCPPLLAALLLCGCATDTQELRWRQQNEALWTMAERETRRRREHAYQVMEATVAEVLATCAWELSRVARREGARLVVRLRVDGQRMTLRGCEAERGQGREVGPLEEVRFHQALMQALRQQAWGWSGDAVLVLHRLEEEWWVEEDGTSPPPARRATRPPVPREEPPPLATPANAARLPLAPQPPSRNAAARRQEEQEREAAEAERWRAVEQKLHAYEAWGRRLMETYAPPPRLLEPGYLLTEHPLREQSLDALVRATLAWAYTHTDDPDFLRRSPTEVALYLLASRSALATVLELGRQAPPHLDYTPPYVRPYTEDELLQELVVGLIPYVGDLADLDAATSGYSLTGHRLGNPERFLAVLGVVLPFTSGNLLRRSGAQVLERVALLSGRSLHEVHVLSRVASHLSPQDVHEVERLMRSASAGRSFTQQELEFLNRVARGLETPLREAAEALRRGRQLPLLGVRTLPDGSRLLPGSPEHLAQRWVDYQFRHPGRYPRFSYSVDPEWERLYRTILANKPAGNAFESSILQTHGYPKNTAVMMPPPGSKAQGFIPDSVPRNPNPDELVWGRPYDFVEAKARNELALTGNLKAMIEYVERYGGHIELWVRSSPHPSGATRLTGSLQKRLSELMESGRASIRRFP